MFLQSQGSAYKLKESKISHLHSFTTDSLDNTAKKGHKIREHITPKQAAKLTTFDSLSTKAQSISISSKKQTRANVSPCARTSDRPDAMSRVLLACDSKHNQSTLALLNGIYLLNNTRRLRHERIQIFQWKCMKEMM